MLRHCSALDVLENPENPRLESRIPRKYRLLPNVVSHWCLILSFAGIPPPAPTLRFEYFRKSEILQSRARKCPRMYKLEETRKFQTEVTNDESGRRW